MPTEPRAFDLNEFSKQVANRTSSAAPSVRRWFLSYNSQDHALAEGLASALQCKDGGARIYFAPASMRAGGMWLPQLAQEIAEATVFVLLVGEKGIGPWQAVEYYEALHRHLTQRNLSIVPLLFDGQSAPGLPFLRQLHWVITADPASEKSLVQLIDAAAGGGAPPGELWRHTRPYRGLEAMTESDADFFFGRARETIEVIGALAASPDKLPILIGDSGVGKSSLARAGVIAALMRQTWHHTAEPPGAWPQALKESRAWCVLTFKPGVEPVRALVEPFIRTWQLDYTDPRRETRQIEWTESLMQGRATLRGLLDATEECLREKGQSGPPAFLLYIDQAEELYVRGDARQRRCFSKILAEGLADQRLRALMSLRADFFGALQKDEPLYAVHRQINVPPLREAQLCEVVSRPAALLCAHFETDHLAGDIAKSTAEESTADAGALPLLSYLLDDMWSDMVRRADGVLRLPMQAIELERVLVERANRFIAEHPASEESLQRILTLRLATVREGSEPTRRRALRFEFSDDEWRLVSELADHPYRLLVTTTSEMGETHAEVAHEAIFRRWDKLGDWIAAEREFLSWRTGLEAARRAWGNAPDVSKSDALLMGFALAQAQDWLAKHPDGIADADRFFIDQSTKRDSRTRTRARRAQAAIYALMAGIIAILGLSTAGVLNRGYIEDSYFSIYNTIRQSGLQTGEIISECGRCPSMVVVPPGSFWMGKGRTADDDRVAAILEEPLLVTIKYSILVSRFEITFAEWDACVEDGGCAYKPDDQGFGRGDMPVFNVSWIDTRQYVSWLRKKTGMTYRLLSEAEWEYAARGITRPTDAYTNYPWGDGIGVGRANCVKCGGEPNGNRPALVGSFQANAFGIFDMNGNVSEWVQDPWVWGYADRNKNRPVDGSALETAGNASAEAGDAEILRTQRGGGWTGSPYVITSRWRYYARPGNRNFNLGFRVARMLPSRF
jgi:formylglycine-generating enzyme required for sulfatase activity